MSLPRAEAELEDRRAAGGGGWGPAEERMETSCYTSRHLEPLANADKDEVFEFIGCALCRLSFVDLKCCCSIGGCNIRWGEKKWRLKCGIPKKFRILQKKKIIFSNNWNSVLYNSFVGFRSWKNQKTSKNSNFSLIFSQQLNIFKKICEFKFKTHLTFQSLNLFQRMRPRDSTFTNIQ